MKETVKINLNGLLFDLDSDAYDKLKAYLDSLRANLSGSAEEIEEILGDIESRIAEILQSKITDSKQVITLADIEEIISLLGTAEEMVTEDPEAQESYSENARSQTGKGNKRFYRDPSNSVLGGVCSGLASYFNIDVIWIRLIFVFLFFFNLAGLIIYVILWFVLPPARTTAQRLEMQGKRVTINDIEDAVKNEYEKVKTNVKDFSKSEGVQKAQNTASEILEVFGKILLTFVKIIAIIIGVGLFLALISAITGLAIGGATFLPFRMFDHMHFHNVFPWHNVSLMGICLFLVLIIPVVGLLTAIIRLLFGIKSTNRVGTGIAATVWVVAFISLIVLIVVEGERGLFRHSKASSYSISSSPTKTLYVNLHELNSVDEDTEYYQIFNFRFAFDDYHDVFLKHPELKIESTENSEPKLIINRSYANVHVGKLPQHQYEIADYGWKQNDSVLYLDEFYTSDEDNAWRMPFVSLTLLLPEGQKVYFDDEMETILYNQDYAGKHMIMDEGVLVETN